MYCSAAMPISDAPETNRKEICMKRNILALLFTLLCILLCANLASCKTVRPEGLNRPEMPLLTSSIKEVTNHDKREIVPY